MRPASRYDVCAFTAHGLPTYQLRGRDDITIWIAPGRAFGWTSGLSALDFAKPEIWGEAGGDERSKGARAKPRMFHCQQLSAALTEPATPATPP